MTLDWCAPPSGASVTPEGVATRMKRDADVQRVDERIEAARDERVVDRAERDQRLVEQLRGQPELGQPHEQVHLADAQLDVLAGRSGLPVEAAAARRRGRATSVGREDAHPVDPAAQVGGHRHVRRGGHDARPKSVHPRQRGQRVAQDLLGRRLGRDAHVDVGGDRHGAAMRPAAVRASPELPSPRRAAAGPPASRARSPPTGRPASAPRRRRQRRDLVRVEHRRVVERVAREGQPPALDGVGEDDAGPRPVGVRLVEDPHEAVDVVAAEVRREPRQSRVVGASRATRAGRRGRSRSAPASRRSRASAPGRRIRPWYSSLGMSSMRRRSVSPPGHSNAACSRLPYLASSTCQPAARNICSRRRMRMPGTTRSRLWRLRSTSRVTLPRPWSGSSSTASQTLPSSSSASPTVATNRRSGQRRPRPRGGRAGTRRRAPRTWAPPRPARPTRSRSRPGRGPWSATDTTGARRTSGAVVSHSRSRSPIR